MPRYPRAFVVGYPHHIVQRGHDRQVVFSRDEDFTFYLKNLAEQVRIRSVRVFAYCLMGNHVHLIVQPERSGEDISTLMKVLAARQTRHTNRLEGRSGTLWEGRFRCSLIETDRYLLACARYVDRNPLAARIVTRLEDYPWSSFLARSGQCLRPSWLSWDPPYLGLGAGDVERGKSYLSFVEEGTTEKERALITDAVQRNQLTGSERFAESLKGKIGWKIENRGRGRPRRRAVGK